MAIIVETGAGVIGANSYVAVSDADTFFSNIGNTDWQALDPVSQKAPYLLQAQYYMTQNFRMRWLGYRHTNTQALDWPRLYVNIFDNPSGFGPVPSFYDPSTIPQLIKDAQCLLAVKCINGPLAPDIDRVTSSEQIGSLKVTYADYMPAITIFRDVELLLRPVCKIGGINAQVGRA